VPFYFKAYDLIFFLISTVEELTQPQAMGERTGLAAGTSLYKKHVLKN